MKGILTLVLLLMASAQSAFAIMARPDMGKGPQIDKWPEGTAQVDENTLRAFKNENFERQEMQEYPYQPDKNKEEPREVEPPEPRGEHGEEEHGEEHAPEHPKLFRYNRQ